LKDPDDAALRLEAFIDTLQAVVDELRGSEA
jgi:hypothetical protein